MADQMTGERWGLDKMEKNDYHFLSEFYLRGKKNGEIKFAKNHCHERIKVERLRCA